jgi:hypothetical protein
MALYAALTFWLIVIMFTAWGVHEMWSGLVKRRVVNAVLLPGTVVAQIAHLLGVLLSGASVRNAKLMGDDEKGDPESDPPEKTRLPVVGPILIGLLPLVACAVCLHLSAQYLGDAVINRASDTLLPKALPLTLAGFFDLLHTSVDLVEGMLDAIIRSDLPNVWTAIFLYLAVCLTVRMAPFEGHQRGAIGAIVLAAVVISVVASLVPNVRLFIEYASWPILSFAVAMLLFLLLVSLLIRGLVDLIRILARNQ